jgi:hypothetical protein
MLTLEEQAYSQQKNREYIYEECQAESLRLFDRYNWKYIDQQHEYKCKQCNITPWLACVV